VLAGGAAAFAQGHVNVGTLALSLIGAVCAHAGANAAADYFDFKKGNLGNKVQQFHDSPLIDGRVTLEQVMIATILCLGVAAGCGIYLLLALGLPVLVPVLVGAFIVFFYTSPPLRLNYRGLGETLLFLAFGPMTVTGVYYVLSGRAALEPLLVSIMPGVFTMNVGVVSNIFDVPDDIKSGKRTLPVRFGQANTVRFMAATSGLAYIAVAVGVLADIVPIWALLSLLTVPLAAIAVRHASHFKDETHYTPAMTRAIALSSLSSALLLLAYLI